MHRYWPATFPEDYTNFKMPNDWVNNYKNEIWNSLSISDQQCQFFLDFIRENQEFSLVIVSSMGQYAVEKSEIMQNQLLLTNPSRLMSFLNVSKDKWRQHLAMSPQYIIKNKIRENRINYNIMSDKSIRMDFGHINFEEKELIYFGNKVINLCEIGLEIIRIQDLAGSYAYHIPEGILVIFNGSNKQSLQKVINTTYIAPSILDHFGIKIPEYMNNPIKLF